MSHDQLKWVRYRLESWGPGYTTWASPIPGVGIFTIGLTGEKHYATHRLDFEQQLNADWGEKAEAALGESFTVRMPDQPVAGRYHHSLKDAKKAAQAMLDEWEAACFRR